MNANRWEEARAKIKANKQELKPCPFCGGKAEFRHHGYTGYMFVQCQKCCCNSLISMDIKKVVYAWNKRV